MPIKYARRLRDDLKRCVFLLAKLKNLLEKNNFEAISQTIEEEKIVRARISAGRKWLEQVWQQTENRQESEFLLLQAEIKELYQAIAKQSGALEHQFSLRKRELEKLLSQSISHQPGKALRGGYEAKYIDIKQ